MARRSSGRSSGASRGGGRYAAVAGPRGVHLVEYAAGRQGLEAVAGVHQPGRPEDVAELAGLVARAVGSLGGRGGELALALTGFGTAHHVLSLPDADPAVLEPVVERELLRYYPSLDDPVIGFVRVAEPERGPEPKREVLVGAVPAAVAHELYDELAGRRLRLRHLTVLPQVLQSVYDAFDGAPAPAVVLLMPETGPLIGCFHDAALRLFIEPPLDLHGRPLREPAAVAEQVQRANLFLRQQFPGSAGGRLILAADDADRAALAGAAGGAMDGGVTELPGSSPGAVVALGAALSAGSPDGIELLPHPLRPLAPSERLTRRLAATAAVVVAAAALLWAGTAVAEARSAETRVRAAESRLEARSAWVDGTRTLLERRRAHEHRLLFLDRTAATRSELRRILAAVSSATVPAVTLETLRVEAADRGWRVLVTGQATGGSSAAAVRAVDALYRGVPDRLPVTDIELGELVAAPAADGTPVAITFDMSFIVRREPDLQP